MKLPRWPARQGYRVWDEAEFLASHARAASDAVWEPERSGRARVVVPTLLLAITAIVVVTIATRSQSALRGSRRSQAQAPRPRRQPPARTAELVQIPPQKALTPKIGNGDAPASVSVGVDRRRTRALTPRASTPPAREPQAAGAQARAIASVAVPSGPHEFGFER